MEVFARLENIEFHIKQLKSKCEVLKKENELLKATNNQLQEKIEIKSQAIHNLEETNKISKLAQSANLSNDTSEFKLQIDQIIHEIDECLNLVKQ